MNEAALSDAHRQELRRGAIVPACLPALRRRSYGYALLEELAGAGLPIAGNTLYPLLRRLEAQGLLTGEWDTTATRPHKFYRTSAEGRRRAHALLREWQSMNAALQRLDLDSAAADEVHDTDGDR